MQLALTAIRLDGDTQPRAQLDLFTVEEYAQAMSEGETFPPIVAYHDGDAYWLADGFHRVHAALQLAWATIDADIRQGTRRDAVLYSVGANSQHGLPRTIADKRQAVITLLNDTEWGQWSDREIARQCHVSHTYVAQLRAVTGNVASERRYTHRDGVITVMQTGNINAGRITLNAAPVADQEHAVPPATFNATYTAAAPVPDARPLIPMVPHTPPPQPEASIPTGAARYPLGIILTRAVYDRWQTWKDRVGVQTDTHALESLLNHVGV